MFAIVGASSGKSEAATEKQLKVLEQGRRDGGDAAAADRCKVVVLEGGTGSGYAFEEPDRTRSWDREYLKATTATGTNGVNVVAISRLKRTTKLQTIMQSMGLGNEMSDPNLPPPSDADIMMAYYNKMIAKQRWAKAGNALGALRAMKLASGGLGALGGASASSAKQDSPVDSPTDSPVHPALANRKARMSVTFINGDEVAKKMAKHKMSQLPKSKDIVDILRSLEGHFAFVIMDTKKEYVLVARSEATDEHIHCGIGPDGSLFFSTDAATLPKDADTIEMPQGSFFIGRYNGNGLDDLKFRTYVQPPATQAA